MNVVTGIYHDPDAVTDAVRALLGASIPSDSIEVEVKRSSGEVERVPVHDETGVLRGAILGAKIGAGVGAVLMAAVTIWVAVSAGESPWTAQPLSAALQGAFGGIIAGVTLGGIIGIGRWGGMRGMDAEALRGGEVHVSVRSNDLADEARRVLSETGARDVSTAEG